MTVESSRYTYGRFALLDDLSDSLSSLDIPEREQAHLYAVLYNGTIKEAAKSLNASSIYMSQVLCLLAQQVHDQMRLKSLAQMLPENYYYLLLMEIFNRQAELQLERVPVIQNFMQRLEGPAIKLGQTQHIISFLLSNGYTINQIAYLIELPLQTVKNSAANIYRKFGISELYPPGGYKSIAAALIYHHHSDFIH